MITKFRVRAFAVDQPGTVTLRVGDVSRPNPSDDTTAVATVTGTGPTVPIPVIPDPETPVREFAAQLPIKQGQHLELDPSATVNAVYASSGSKFTYSFEPPLVDGQGPRGSTDVTEELLVQVTIEPDADGDGFGDETQDQCPTQADTHGPCASPPPPQLSVGGAGVSGGRIAYTLSRDATVSLALAKRVAGRKVKGRCVKATRKNRRRKACQALRGVQSNVRHGARRGGRELPAVAQAQRAQAPARELSPHDHRNTPGRDEVQRDSAIPRDVAFRRVCATPETSSSRWRSARRTPSPRSRSCPRG